MNQVRRGRHKAADWPALLEQWSTSGESAERFGARIGVKPSTLTRWRKAVGSKSQRASVNHAASAAPVFARVQVVEPSARVMGMIEVVIRDGLLVRLHGAVDANTLATVLGCAARC